MPILLTFIHAALVRTLGSEKIEKGLFACSVLIGFGSMYRGCRIYDRFVAFGICADGVNLLVVG